MLFIYKGILSSIERSKGLEHICKVASQLNLTVQNVMVEWGQYENKEGNTFLNQTKHFRLGL